MIWYQGCLKSIPLHKVPEWYYIMMRDPAGDSFWEMIWYKPANCISFYQLLPQCVCPSSHKNLLNITFKLLNSKGQEKFIISIRNYLISYKFHFLPVIYTHGKLYACSWTTLQYQSIPSPLNILRPRGNGQHFADDIFTYIFLKENDKILIQISL